MAEHKLATAADFRNDVREEDCYEPAREVFLPKSRKWVLLRRPKPLAYTLLGAPLPGIPEEDAKAATIEDAIPENAPVVENAQPSAAPVGSQCQLPSQSERQSETKRQELLQMANWSVALWDKVFIHPKLSLTPGEGEIHPEWIPPDDQTFIWKWIRGEVKDSGESLSTFPANIQG